MLTQSGRRKGFTLVELLVVLAILVLLFGLLFAPMMTSLDLAKAGQARARMQDTVRYAMEKIQRTVSNALYVLPLDTIYPTADPTLAYVNTSQLIVVEARRDPATGALTDPLQPITVPDPAGGREWMEAVRYVVHPRSGRIVRNDDVGTDFVAYPPGSTYSPDYPSSGVDYTPSYDDPFVLFEQRGIWYDTDPDPNVDAFAFGSFDPTTGLFMSNEASSENALSLGDGYDIPCTTSVCDNCGARYPGFRMYNEPCAEPTCGLAAGYTYLFEGIQFAPQYVAGEQLEPLQDGKVYRAEHGGWAGYAHADPTLPAPPLYASRFDPQIVVYRFDTGTGGYTELQYDTYTPGMLGTPPLSISWDPNAGAVRCGRFFEQVITLIDPGGSVAGTETPDEAAINELEPYGGVTAPTRYQIVPNPAAIILPDSVQVRAVATLSTGDVRWMDLVKTEQIEQHEIGEWQFTVKRTLPPASWASWIPENWATSMEILFNDLDLVGPPSPAKFANALGVPLSTVQDVNLHIRYWARRNADIFRAGTPTGRDDIIRVNYHTRNLLDASLTLMEFVDYQEDGLGNYILPAPPPPTPRASLQDTIVVRNAGR